jgi:hypothetical protein
MTQLQSSSVWQESKGTAVAATLLKGLKPVLPAELKKFLPV